MDQSDNGNLPDEVWVEVDGSPTAGVPASTPWFWSRPASIANWRRVGNGVAVLVAPWHAVTARHELAAYAEENRPDPGLPLRRYPFADAVTGVLAYWCVLVFVYAADSHSAFGLDWTSAGEGQAGLTVRGEWWRVVTALGLHGDIGHIASNLVAGSLFGLFLAEILGSGLAWLMILLSGAAGNAINSVIQPAAHTSIGASTAIFGAVGLLAVLAVRHRPPRLRRGLRRWSPVAAGIMLLAFLGIEGPRIDVSRVAASQRDVRWGQPSWPLDRRRSRGVCQRQARWLPSRSLREPG